jgi:hypothetical protein
MKGRRRLLSTVMLAFRTSPTDIREGLPQIYGVRRA